MKKALLLILLVLVVSFGAYACKPKVNTNTQTHNQNHDTPTNDTNFNPFDDVMPPEVKSAYSFAKDNQDLLKKFYCICGCMGESHNPRHKNLAQCYVKSIDSKGKITYDPHGSTCKACIDEAIDVKIMTEKGLKFSELTKEYHKKYGSLPGSPAKWDFK